MKSIKAGQRYGRLISIRQLQKRSSADRRPWWLFKCDCGKSKNIRSNSVVRGLTTSCGCVHREMMRNRSTHGFTRDYKVKRFYRIWSGMKTRCLNKNSSGYYKYGKRGISVCKKWYKFENFRNDMLVPYQKHILRYGAKNTTLERVDNNGNYENSNCIWATLAEQSKNKRHYKMVRIYT